MNREKFSVFIPIEIEKSDSSDPNERYSNMKFKGIASNPNTGNDTDGQWLDPSGFDLSSFLSVGTFNFHHLQKSKPLAVIGEPTKAYITKNNELYVEGKLWPSSQIARDVYDLTEIMEKDSSTRRMGMSIEGVPLQTDPNDKNKITKARITNIAITPAPKCKGTKMELIKGGLDDIVYETQEGSEYLLDTTDENGIRYRVTQDLEIVKGENPFYDEPLEKAIVAGSTTGTDTIDISSTGEALKEESLEGTKKKKKKDNKEYMTKAQVIDELIKTYGPMDSEMLKAMLDFIDQVAELEKGGEGSRGGKVIGHTKSGKAIYDTKGHKDHGDGYTSDKETGTIYKHGKSIGSYDFDRDSDSFWVDHHHIGSKEGGQKSFETKDEMIAAFKKHHGVDKNKI